MNIYTPCGLINKVWFYVMFFLCRRSRENLRQMSKTTFRVAIDSKGNEYIFQKQDELDKTHRQDDMDSSTSEGRMYSVPGNIYCPVMSYKKYLSKLHPARDDLWQKPRDSFDEEGPWYCKAPLGKNTLSNMMPNICKRAKLSQIYNNHSIRATSITLLDTEFSSRDIMKVSGHKSETSIKNYSTKTSDSKFQYMSKFLLTAATETGDANSNEQNLQVIDHSDAENNLVVNEPIPQDVHDVLFMDQEQFDSLLMEQDVPIQNVISLNENNPSSSDVNNKPNQNDQQTTLNIPVSKQNVNVSSANQQNNMMLPQFNDIFNSSFTPYITGCVVNFNVSVNKN